MSIDVSSAFHTLSKPIHFLGLKLWVTIVICTGSLIVILLIIISLCIYLRCRSHNRKKLNKKCGLSSSRVTDRQLLSRRGWDIQTGFSSRMVHSGHSNWSGSGIDHVVDMQSGGCKYYSATELHLATDGFSQGYMISSGEHGEVYRGILLDGKRVAVKKFISKSDNVDKFIEEVEVIYCIRHKNLVKLLGYSIEGPKRMLVYDYIDNGDLHQWIHSRIARISPLTWDNRMDIILGIAKGLVYLHEDSEPIVIHQRLKSSCVLLDRQWNPKISNIGFTKILQPMAIAHSLTGMSGYIAPEYTFTHNFDVRSDLYTFGVLILEIITGRTPLEVIEFGKKEYLVEWLKSKVSDQNFDDIVDPSLPELPSLKELKRIILIALRCVDPEVENRPTIGDVIHMLQPRDLLLDDVLTSVYILMFAYVETRSDNVICPIDALSVGADEMMLIGVAYLTCLKHKCTHEPYFSYLVKETFNKKSEKVSCDHVWRLKRNLNRYATFYVVLEDYLSASEDG